MESRPVYDECVSKTTINGVPYYHKRLHFNSTFLPLVLAALARPEEWSIDDFGGCIVLTGPPFGTAVDLSRDWHAQLPLRVPAPEDRL
jgi:hypothetical protein